MTLEDEVRQAIFDYLKTNGWVEPEEPLNDQPALNNDLGIQGDDADEFFLDLYDRFDIDNYDESIDWSFAPYDIGDYFLDEYHCGLGGFLYYVSGKALLYKLMGWKNPLVRPDFTIGMAIDYICAIVRHIRAVNKTKK